MDRADAFRAVAEPVRGGSEASTLIPTAVDLCRSVSNGEAWDLIAALDWEADRQHCRRWLQDFWNPSRQPVVGRVVDELPASFELTGR